jgi:hypothetical protein
VNIDFPNALYYSWQTNDDRHAINCLIHQVLGIPWTKRIIKFSVTLRDATELFQTWQCVQSLSVKCDAVVSVSCCGRRCKRNVNVRTHCTVTAYRNTVSCQCGRDSWPRNVPKVGYAVKLRHIRRAVGIWRSHKKDDTSIALIVQHTKRVLQITLLSVACLPAPYCSTVSHKRLDILKKKILSNTKCVDFHCNICR